MYRLKLIGKIFPLARQASNCAFNSSTCTFNRGECSTVLPSLSKEYESLLLQDAPLAAAPSTTIKDNLYADSHGVIFAGARQ
jgi:hypothetical protein